MVNYQVLLHQDAYKRASDYLQSLKNTPSPLFGKYLRSILSSRKPGAYLSAQLQGVNLDALDPLGLIDCLVKTKRPQIFAESVVYGDGSDWNSTELSLLGDISIAVPVTVYDNGFHCVPHVYGVPFRATLLYVPGALLRNGKHQTPADWNEVVIGGRIDQDAYNRLYERRLLPTLLYANNQCQKRGVRGVVTLPGLGCGQFAGPFIGRLGECLSQAIRQILKQFHRELPALSVVYYDPYNECKNKAEDIGHIRYKVRPLLNGNETRPQLCKPEEYADFGENYSGCRLYSVVAWDHVSWPGNDFYVGARATDDGVKAAATSSMCSITGVTGHYNAECNKYMPPVGYSDWEAVVKDEQLELCSGGRISVLPKTVVQ